MAWRWYSTLLPHAAVGGDGGGGADVMMMTDVMAMLTALTGQAAEAAKYRAEAEAREAARDAKSEAAINRIDAAIAQGVTEGYLGAGDSGGWDAPNLSTSITQAPIGDAGWGPGAVGPGAGAPAPAP